MSEQNEYNRWFVVVGAILIQLALGTIYCWGVLTVFISDPGLLTGVPATTTVYVFGVGLASFAVVMILAGQLQQKIGPMKTSILGGVVLGVGVMSSAAAASFETLLLTYGVIFGAGIGLGYVCPIATAAKWFPDKKGFINGIAVAGFGAGAFIFNYVIKALANPSGLDVLDPGFHDAMVANIPTMFLVLGAIYAAMVIVGAITLKLPPEGWKPAGWEPPAPKEGEVAPTHADWTPGEAIRTPQFWMLWAMFVMSAISGLMVIGSFAKFAKDTGGGASYLYPELAGLDFAMVGGIAALLNGLGRVVWGKACDVVGYKKAMLSMFSVQGVIMILYFFTNSSAAAYVALTGAIYFCFGGNFSMFPTATADAFGSKNLGPNYGVVFTAYGIAGFLGATMVQTFVTAFGSYMVLFIVMGALSLASAGISVAFKPPVKQ
ncbi:MAG: OFA family MFS transporter [Promethearchaeota archaeon]